MRHFIFAILLSFLPLQVLAFEIEDRLILGPENASKILKVVSTTDASLFRPVLEAFLSENPETSVEYVVASSTELMKAIAEEGATFDVAISSAMDLQTKLANDRLSLSHSSAATTSLPDWARWREDVFAFTQEPAAIVLSKQAFDGLELPKTREDLIALLRSHPDRFEEKIGTYDLRYSGLGYLFATQDSRMSEVYWRLTEVMGSLHAKLYRSSAKMIDDVATGKLAVAYNVLGSYALSREDQEEFIVLFPADFTTVMMRTVLIPSTAENEESAARFVDFLLQIAWQNQSEPSPLSPLLVDLQDDANAIRRIRLGPGLLVYLDAYKKKRFLSAWENSILQ